MLPVQQSPEARLESLRLQPPLTRTGLSQQAWQAMSCYAWPVGGYVNAERCSGDSQRESDNRRMRCTDDDARDKGSKSELRSHCAAIALLEKEKAQNNYRILAGIQTVAPALAVLNIVADRYGQNVAIATGEWGQTIDRKLVELRRAKRKC